MNTADFSDALVSSIAKARQTAKKLNNSELQPEHVFFHLLDHMVVESIIQTLTKMGIDSPLSIQAEISRSFTWKEPTSEKEPVATPRLEKIIRLARDFAKTDETSRKGGRVYCHHFLIGCVLEGNNIPF